jgi:drug/metabolite transporter (DMT)-like permease
VTASGLPAKPTPAEANRTPTPTWSVPAAVVVVLVLWASALTVPARQATWLGCTAAAIAVMPFAPQTVHELAHARAGDILLAVYLGAFPTALGFLLWGFALSRSTAGSLGSTTLAVPAIAVLMSWILLDQLPTATAGIGGAVCLIGVVIATVRRRGSADRV